MADKKDNDNSILNKIFGFSKDIAEEYSKRYNPIRKMYNLPGRSEELNEEYDEEYRRTITAIGPELVQGAIDLYRLFDEPTEKEELKTAKTLQDFYTATILDKDDIEIVKDEGGRFITKVKQPSTFGGQFVRQMGEIGAAFVGAKKFTAPIGAASKYLAPAAVVDKGKKAVDTITFGRKGLKTFGAATLQAEAALQVALNPYEERLADVLGGFIADDDEGLYGVIEEYLLDPLKADKDKSELENRISLLGEGLITSGVLGLGFASLGYAGKNWLLPVLKSVKEKGSDTIESFMNKLKNYSSDYDSLKFAREESFKKRKITSANKRAEESKGGQKDEDLGDLGGFNETFLGLNKFSFNPAIRGFSNFLANTFTSRGSMTKKMFQTKLKYTGVQAKFDKTIENTMLNLDSALQKVFKSTDLTDEKLFDDLNLLLFSDYRVPGIITSRGTKAPITQRAEFLRKLNQFPEEVREPILNARKLQDDLSKLLLDSPYISKTDKKKITDQLGFYARRSYKAFEDPNYKPTAKQLEAVRSFLREKIISKNPKADDKTIEEQVKSAIDLITKKEGEYVNLIKQEGKLANLNKNILEKQRKVPKEIREFYGEVINPVERLTISMNKLSRFITDLDFYETLFKDGDGIYFFDKANRPTRKGQLVKIPSAGDNKFKSKKAKEDASIIEPFGALSGKYTTPNLARFFTERAKYNTPYGFEETADNIFANTAQYLYKGWMYFKGFTQRAKTVWNQGTHLQNTLGGAHATMAQGAFPTSKEFTKAWGAVRDNFLRKTDKEQQAYVEKLTGLNIINKGPVAREIKGLMRDYADIKNPLDFGGGKLKTRNTLLSKIKEKDSKFSDDLTDIYIAEDDFFKILMYEVELKNLKKFNAALPDDYDGFFKFKSTEAMEREAANKVIKSLPNYDIIPPNFLSLRRAPIGNFFSFLAESTRIAVQGPIHAMDEITLGNKLIKDGLTDAGKLMRNRGIKRIAAQTTIGAPGELVKIVGNTAVKYGAPVGVGVLGYQAFNRYVTGIDEQQERDLKLFAADFLKNDNLVFTRHPETGKLLMINTSRYDFYDYPNKLITFVPKYIDEINLPEGDANEFAFRAVEDSLLPFFGEAMFTDVMTDYWLQGGRDNNGRLLKSRFLNPGQEFDPEKGTLHKDNLMILVEKLAVTFVSAARYIENYGEDETKFNQEVFEGLEFLKLVSGIGATSMEDEYLESVFEYKTNEFLGRKRYLERQIRRFATEADTPDELIENIKAVHTDYHKAVTKYYRLVQASKRLDINFKSKMDDQNVPELIRKSLGGGPAEYSSNFFPLDFDTDTFEEIVKTNKDISRFYPNIRAEVKSLKRSYYEMPLFDYDNTQESKERVSKSTGGLIIGTEDVPYTEENPADRINPVTGEPYSETSQGVLATLKSRQGDRVPKTHGGLLINLQRRNKFGLGGPALKLLLKGATVPEEVLLKQLPDKVYRGGTRRIINSPEGTKSVFAASDKFHAQTYAAPDAPAKVVASDGKSLDISKTEYNLHEIDISSAKKPYILDAPTSNMKFKIRTKLQELENKFNDINYQPTAKDDDLSDALGVLLGRAESSLTVDSGDFARVARTVGEFLREEGFDLIIDSKTLRKGFINSPEAELYVLGDFPVKAIDDFVPPKVQEQTTKKTNTVKVPTWFKETQVKTDVNPADAQKTQVGITSGTYKKVVPLLKEGNTLDFGAGLGKGAKILKADSYEPFPKKGFEPTFTETSAIPNSSYDNVVSLNVLNVVKPDVRNDIVLDIGRILKPKGNAIITTRGSDIFGNKNNITKGVLSNLEEGAIITSSGTYQKGFTNAELREYVDNLLNKNKYTIYGNGNRQILNSEGELVATYRQFPNYISSEIMLKSSLIKKENREEFLSYLKRLVEADEAKDNVNIRFDPTTSVFLVNPKISGGGKTMNTNKYPAKLVNFLNKQFEVENITGLGKAGIKVTKL